VPYEKVKVECYSGHRVNERPVAFIFGDRRWEIVDVIDRWFEGRLRPGRPTLDYFKVKTSEGRVFLLRYNSLFDAWAVHLPPESTH
jgi:hypothetical protein